jgi:hypothetical protein
MVIVMSQSQALRLGLLVTSLGAPAFPNINKDGGFV